MRPLRLFLEDFMSHRSTDVDCTQFRSVLVVGRFKNDPRKSMGVGKSNIFKALEYVLFGETQVKLDKIIRHGCDKCRVTFEFEVSGHSYRVVRSRFRKSSKSDLRMYQKVVDTWTDITQKTATETEQELAKIVKISHVAFRSSILFAQADLHGLASVTPRERKAMLKEPLQISVYNKYEKIAKEKVATALKSVEKTRTIIEGLGKPADDLTKLSLEKVEVQTQLNGCEAQQAQLQISLAGARVEYVELQKANVINVDELYQQLAKIQQDKKAIHEKIKTTSIFLNKDENQREIASQNLVKAQDVLVKLEENKVVLTNRVIRPKAEIKEDISKMTTKEIDGKAYISKLQSDRTKLSRVIPDGDMCEHCNQPVSKEHRESCEGKRKQDLSEVLSNLEKYTSVLETVKAKRVKYEAELSEVDIRDNSLTTLSNKISAKKSEIEQIKLLLKQFGETINLRRTELKAQVDNESVLIPQELAVSKKIEDYKNSSIPSSIDEIKRRVFCFEADVKAGAQKISGLHVTLGMIEERLSAREKDKDKLLKLQEELELKEKELSMRMKVQQAFGSSGIPTMIINTILDDLQIIANDLLTKIRPGIEIIFSVAKTKSDGQQEDTLDITYRINGIEHEYEQMSGGQKVIISLCLKLALSLIIQHRIGVDIKFLMLDEVDSQFDESALEAFVEVIRKWQDRFTIFVITHNKDLKDKFAHAILVEGDDVNGAVGTLVNSW